MGAVKTKEQKSLIKVRIEEWGRIFVSFSYNPEVAKVKTIPGRKYHPDKYWSFPNTKFVAENEMARERNIRT